MAVTIVALGDSKVAGSGDLTNGGFRGPIQVLAAATGMDYAWQGSQSTGSIPQPFHEGISGDTIAMVAARTNTALLTYKPDIVLLEAGINDCALALGTAAQIAANLMALVDQIHAWRAGCWVLVDTLTPNLTPATETLRVAVNALLPGLVAAQVAAGQKTMLVYAGSSINPATELSDLTHPNQAGYTQMAGYWHDAMRQVVALLQAVPVDDQLLLLGSALYPAGEIMEPAGALFSSFEGMAPNHHVVLGTTGLLLDKGGYGRKAAQQLAAQFSVTGISNKDRITDQAFDWSDWSDGEGYLIYSSATPARFRADSGTDGFTIDGSLSLGPFLGAVAAVTGLAVNAINCMIVYNGLLMLGLSNGKVYQWDGTTLTLNYDTTKTAGIASFMIWESCLYVGTYADGIVYRWTGGSPTAGWAANFTVGPMSGDTVTAVSGLSPHFQLTGLFGFYAANEAGHALVGQIANTGGTTSPTGVNTTKLLEPSCGYLGGFRDRLIAIGNDVANQSWRLYDGSDADPVVWTVRGRVEGGIVTAGAVLQPATGDDVLYLATSTGKIWSFDGTHIKLVTTFGSDLAPYPVSILGMVGWRGGLWVSARQADGTLGLRRFDGAKTWHRPSIGLLGNTPGPVAIYKDRLQMATNATGAARLYSADGTFAASGSVESGLIDADLPGTNKKWDRVFVRHSVLVAGQSLTIFYRLNDTGTWLQIGTSNVVGSTSAVFDFMGNIVADTIAFTMTLGGVAAGSASPLTLYQMVATYRPAPRPKREWDLKVLLRGNRGRYMSLENGDVETHTGEEISAAIWDLVDANVPVTYLDIDRTKLYVVQIVDWTDSDATNQRVGLLGQGWELDGSLKLREV